MHSTLGSSPISPPKNGERQDLPIVMSIIFKDSVL